MKSKKVHFVLEQLCGDIEADITINNEVLGFLKEKEFISTMPTKEYEELAKDVSKIPALSEEIYNNASQTQTYSDSIHMLKQELTSPSHKLLAGIRAKFGKIDELAEKFERVQKEHEELGHDYTLMRAEMNILKEKRSKIKDFIKTNQGYIKPTNLARKRFDHLDARIERLKDVSFDDFEKEYEDRLISIQERYGKFIRIKEGLINEYLISDSKQLENCALALSGLEGKVEDICLDGAELYTLLDKLSSTKRLPIIAELLTHKNNDVGDLKNNLENMYEIMLENGERKESSTKEAAARIMKHRWGFDKSEPYFLYYVYQGLQNRLKKEWGGQEYQYNFLASHLVEHNKNNLNPKPTISIFKDHYNSLKSLGSMYGFQTQVASLILMADKEKDLDDKTERFDQTIYGMKTSGWIINEGFYPTAAAISLMPGTVKENVQMVEEVVVDLLKYARFGFVSTNKAVALMNGGYVFESYLNFIGG